MSGFVYFIQGGDSGLVKIGYTLASAENRLSQLQIGSPVPLRLLGVIPAEVPEVLEDRLHRRFADRRRIGEWFDLCESDFNQLLSEGYYESDHYQGSTIGTSAFDVRPLRGGQLAAQRRRKTLTCPVCGQVLVVLASAKVCSSTCRSRISREKNKPAIPLPPRPARKTEKGAEMKLTVIFRNDAPLIHCGDTPSYRSIQVELTPEQLKALALRCGTEEISKCFIEPKEPK